MPEVVHQVRTTGPRAWLPLFALAMALTALGQILFITVYLQDPLWVFPEVGAWNAAQFMFSYRTLAS